MTDKHAYAATANYYNDTTFLNQIDWPLLQKRNFQKDLNDPGKIERYQAEALIYQHVPLKALLGVICYSEELKIQLQSQIASLGLQLKVYCRPNWYF